MFKFTKTGAIYVFTTVIFLIIQIFINKYKLNINIAENIMDQSAQKFSSKTDLENSNEEITEWKIEIPKISLEAQISEGTTKEILNQYVGHFETTQKENGNIGLAAHNRGYKVNYFQDLKLLEKGDVIKYTYNNITKIYIVEKSRIIKDTDWEYLENTDENQLTLITCVENQPEYRRCIQAIEKEEDKY